MGFGLFAEGSLFPAVARCKAVELVAITKRREQDAVEKARALGIDHAYATGDGRFLSDPGIDAVFVATPNVSHHDDVTRALAAGKHVIVEKPMAMNAAECQDMIDVARRHYRALMVAHCLRFNTTVAHVKSLVEGGTLGRLLAVTCDFMSQGRASKRAWKYDMGVAGGGAAFDLGVHLVDTIRHLAGGRLREARVIAEPARRGPGHVDELAAFTVSFDNGVVGRATASYEGPRHTFLEAYGTRGYARAFDFQPANVPVQVESEIDGTLDRYTIQNEDHYALEMDAFAWAIANGRPVPIPGEEGLANQRVIDLVSVP